VPRLSCSALGTPMPTPMRTCGAASAAWSPTQVLRGKYELTWQYGMPPGAMFAQ